MVLVSDILFKKVSRLSGTVVSSIIWSCGNVEEVSCFGDVVCEDSGSYAGGVCDGMFTLEETEKFIAGVSHSSK